ncbi:hypothetical protein CR983_00310 [Candidatus Saccharibacteria bacterium]|nr:MAG: hypothetical protein CR983_00310 [Candidatus Saccharibacteria bacterium]
MNASAIFGKDEDTMSLEEKLAAIDQAMKNAQAAADQQAAANGQASAPLDPASLTVCDGCE